MNHIEHACRKFLDGHINEKSFRDYYATYLDTWVSNLPKLKSSPESDEFEDIVTTYKILKHEIPKPKKFLPIMILIGLVSIYVLLMFNCYAFCFINNG